MTVIPETWEAEAGDSQIQSQLGQLRLHVSKNKKGRGCGSTVKRWPGMPSALSFIPSPKIISYIKKHFTRRIRIQGKGSERRGSRAVPGQQARRDGLSLAGTTVMPAGPAASPPRLLPQHSSSLRGCSGLAWPQARARLVQEDSAGGIVLQGDSYRGR